MTAAPGAAVPPRAAAALATPHRAATPLAVPRRVGAASVRAPRALARRRVASRRAARALVAAALALAAIDAGAPAAHGAVPPPATPFVSLPIGAGEAFQPPARWPLAGQASFGGLRGDIHAPARAHLEVFAYRQVVVIPGGIGVSGGRTELYGTVVDAPAHARAWTLQPGGVIQLAAPGITLGEFFAVWGQPPDLGFAGELRTFVNGVERHGDPARIALHDADQVVITVGGYVPPHRRFTFTPRRSP